MLIRSMAEADLDAALAIANALPLAPQWPRTVYAEALHPAAALRRIALVAESGGVVAGLAVASVVAQEGEIESIAVAAGAQRRGIGAALLGEVLRVLQAAGAEAVVLEVRESNGAAIGLYARAGFQEVGRRRRYYRDPMEDAVLMRLEMPCDELL